MLIDAQDLAQDAEISGSIAIIGGGAAGIVLAIELAKHFRDVVVLESGGLEFEQATQDLYRGNVFQKIASLPSYEFKLPETPLEASRLRFFGGTTNHWTGVCSPFDAEDFKRIPDHPYSGWPIQLDDLAPFYARAYSYCEIGDYEKPPAILAKAEPIARQILDSPDFELAEFRQSPPTRFGERYRLDLASSERVKVYLHANVTDLPVSSNGKAISSLEVRTLNGRVFKVLASAFILCCGGIENARILLNCTRYFPAGIGNKNDLVGRFFMNNPSASVGTIVPQDSNFNLGPMHLGQDGSIPVKVAFKNLERIATLPGRRGASIFLTPIIEEDSTVVQVRNTPSFEAVRSMLQDLKHRRIPTDFAKKAQTALEDPVSVASAIFYRVAGMFQAKKPMKGIWVRIEGAQRPNPDSRITLNNGVDVFGMRRVTLDWRITDEDYDNLYQTSIAFARGVGAAGFGRMILEISEQKNLSKISGTGHHLGTTRMHNDPQHGVVDQNCKVHDLDNLFIAGSSVFSTGPRVNPTLNIIALAIRLADHLRTKVKAT